MKTLLIILFSTISCYSQNFMMKMTVMEIYKDTTINSKNVKVIWGIDGRGSVSLVWGNPKKIVYLTRKPTYPSFKQKKIINGIVKKYNIKGVKKFNQHLKVYSMFLDEKNDVYFVTIYMYEGVLIWISRIENNMEDRVPCYFFSMTNN